MLRENLAEILEAEEEWTQAAQTLAGIDLDSGTWQLTSLANFPCMLLIFLPRRAAGPVSSCRRAISERICNSCRSLCHRAACPRPKPS